MAEPGVALAESEVDAWDVFHALLVGQPNVSARHCTAPMPSWPGYLSVPCRKVGFPRFRGEFGSVTVPS